MRDKLNDKPFMKKLKASLNNVDDNIICKKDSLKDALIALKKYLCKRDGEEEIFDKRSQIR